ncbi:MAG TPA: type II CAAX endopeptidase family protein [Longimicrobium sp.]|nr:type II CAAX endopeptidase family protein [Longimicrobium sp.]
MTPSIILQIVLVAFLVVVFPFWDRSETRRLKTSADPRVRVKSYQKTIAWQIAATAVLVAIVPVRSLLHAPGTPRELGINLSGRETIPILAAMLAGALIPVLVARIKGPKVPATPKQLEAIAFILPRGRTERAWFAAMAMTVGVCEEIIFRGWLIRFLAEGPPVALGLAGGVIAAAVIFGIDHGYQGLVGIVATGVLALVFTALFLITGTLWIPMLVHALIDLRVLLLVPRTGLPAPADPPGEPPHDRSPA